MDNKEKILKPIEDNEKGKTLEVSIGTREGSWIPGGQADEQKTD